MGIRLLVIGSSFDNLSGNQKKTKKTKTQKASHGSLFDVSVSGPELK
jgi:hypothetical protein